MAYLISAAIALAALTGVRADSNCSYSLNVKAQTDLDAISTCSTFTGDITISGSAATLVLNGVQSIKGNLKADNISTLTSISAPRLTNITEALSLTNLVALNTLSMPVLTKLGSLELEALPQLEALQFNAGVSECDSVVISNTRLTSLDGLNLSAVSTFDVNNNNYISDISVDVTSISQALDISFNSDSVKVSMPNLIWANNATFQFCGSVSMPKLQTVNTSMGFINNTMSSLDFTNLTSVGASLAFVSNAELSNLNFSKVGTIGGGFSIANNSDLDTVNGFDSLTKVGGALSFVGVFSDVELPKLNDVEGDVTIESSESLNCTFFDKLNSNKKFRGDNYVCQGKQQDVSTAISADASKSGSSKTSTNSKSGSGSATGSASSSNAGQAAQGVGAIGGLFIAAIHLL